MTTLAKVLLPSVCDDCVVVNILDVIEVVQHVHELLEQLNVVAFDCTKCPVAAFFAAHESSALCTATWCALDFPVAEKWGGQLVRPKTIAGGHDYCDFRWHTMPVLNKDKTGEAAEHAGQE